MTLTTRTTGLVAQTIDLHVIPLGERPAERGRETIAYRSEPQAETIGCQLPLGEKTRVSVVARIIENHFVSKKETAPI